MKLQRYSGLRQSIQDADLLLFGGRALWPSLVIRFWDNGFRWNDWRGWCRLGPWSHAEIAHWDLWSRSLEAWGSVTGGPRKVPLSRLLYRYGSFGWAPFLGSDVQRNVIIGKANQLWRLGQVNYPSMRQYVRTALRGLYGEKVDVDPYGYTCWEWVATVHGLDLPAAKYASDLIACGKFGELVEVSP